MELTIPGPDWLAYVSIIGVLLAFALWCVVTDERWSAARAPVAAGGVTLLLIAGGGLVSRVGYVSYLLGSSVLSDRKWWDVALAVAGVAIGLYAATYAIRHPAADDPLDDQQDGDGPYAAAAPPPIPSRAWGSTEVLGAATPPGDGADDEGEGEPPVPLAERIAGSAPGRVTGQVVVRVVDRGVAVPLLAVAIGLGLPVVGGLAGSGEFQPFGHASAARIALAVLAPFLIGGALVGAALALDVWERRLVAAAFALLAVGVALTTGSPRFLANELWQSFSIGLATGLLAPAALRALRRPLAVGRRPLVAGIGVALLLLGAGNYLAQRSLTARPTFTDTTDQVGPTEFPTDFPTDVPTDFPTDFTTSVP